MRTYSCHKGVNRPLEFRGLQAQYIWWVAGLVVVLLLAFAVLHVCGVSSWVCLPVVGVSGGAGIAGIYRLSRACGRHGLMKWRAARRIPAGLRSRSRQFFQSTSHGKAIG